MAGWVKEGGGEWTVVEDGFKGVGAKDLRLRGFLVWGKELADFTVQLEYKTVKGNSGVFFRMGDPDRGTEPNKMGFEVEVDPTRDAGGLQEPGRLARGWITHT